MPNMPESLSALALADAEALRAEFRAAFAELYAGGNKVLSADDETSLVEFANSVKALDAHIDTLARAERTAALAADVSASQMGAADNDDDADDTPSGDTGGSMSTETTPEPEPPAAAAASESSAEGSMSTEASTEASASTNSSELASGSSTKQQEDAVSKTTEPEALVASAPAPDDAASLMAASQAGVAAQAAASAAAQASAKRAKTSTTAGVDSGLPAGETDLTTLAAAIERKVSQSSEAAYRSAFARGQKLEHRYNFASFSVGVSDEYAINDATDLAGAMSVLDKVTNEKALPGGALTASGGWAAPSETDYSMLALETVDGLLSIPTVKINRGGLRYTQGPLFANILANAIFTYTEAQDISGDDYPKGRFPITNPSFTDTRLQASEAFVPAGLLASKGYPELIERTIKGVLVAHAHKVDQNVISAIVAGSTAVTVPSGTVDGVSNIIDAVLLQASHMRSYNRLAMDATLEAVLPFWAKELVRSLLAKRLYVDLIAVPDARIAQYFANLGINVQFVYNWQDIATTAATGFTAFASTMEFLLYPAGTWVKGTADVITLQTIFDSTLLDTNDYTALFTEEAYLVAKYGWDSRVVTVSTATA